MLPSPQTHSNDRHRLRAILLVIVAVVAASYFADRSRAVAPASQEGEECVSCQLYAPPIWEFGRGGNGGKPVARAQEFVADKAK